MYRNAISKSLSITALFIASSIAHAESHATNDALSLVNPFVGTAVNSGAMYPGAALPFSMVKLSPDTTSPSSSGYDVTKPIEGFSHTHIGGTGGATFEGQIRVRPQTGPLNIAPEASEKANEQASPGYYAVDLKADRVHVELTCTERAGFHRYTFPASAEARVLIDLSATINNQTKAKPAGVCKGSTGHFISDREIEGSTSIKAGLAGLTYTVYFVAIFDQPATARGVWLDKTAQPEVLEVKGGENQEAGLYAGFASGATVGMRVGISYTSIDQARRNLEPAKALNFDQVRERAADIWRKHFDTITIDGGTDVQRGQFYTAMYQTVLTPTDVTGDNNGFAADVKEPVYSDIHTLWDTFRSTDPLRILIYPDRERSIVRFILSIYKKTGWLPDAWCHNKRSIPIQGGTHADNVIADAVVKKLGGFDLNLAYEAVRKDATEADPKGGKTFPMQGRLGPYFKLGYVPSSVYKGKDAQGNPNEYSAGVSRTLEYSYNDFCASEVAEAAGHPEEAERFRKQSLNAYKLFQPDTKLFWGKTADGKWAPDADGTKLTWGWTSSFYEGSAWQYRFSMPHDVQGLINHIGGDSAFISVLDEYFDHGLHYSGNEPGFLTPWLYIYAGRPDKSVDRLRKILAKDFSLKPAGYPGDEDVGAMSAFYIFASMGFYPNAGQDVYLIGSPLFTKTTLKLGTSGKTFVISTENLSAENKYVQSATLNGKPWKQAWFRQEDIVNGAELVLRMGSKPSDFGTDSRPPSITAR